MRYTTIIDLSEYTSLYRNHHVRLVYLHMVLRSGWHDEDRDILDLSIRAIAQGAGLSISTVRHALRQLEKSQLIVRQGNVWSVKKWVLQDTPAPRPRTMKEKKQSEVKEGRVVEQAALDKQLEQSRKEREQMLAAGKTPFMLYYESLQKKAAAGDVEAQVLVVRHRAMYEAQVNKMRKSTKK